MTYARGKWRRAFKKCPCGHDIEVRFEDLKPGDVFRLVEPDGTDLGWFTADDAPIKLDDSGNHTIAVIKQEG